MMKDLPFDRYVDPRWWESNLRMEEYKVHLRRREVPVTLTF